MGSGDEPVVTESEAVPDALAADVVGVELLELQLGFELLDVLDPARGGDLLTRVKGLRRKLAGELGFLLPPVRTHDSLDVGPDEYRILIQDQVVGTGRIPRGRVLAMGQGLESLPGEAAVDPVFGLAACWIPEAKTQAQVLGATVVDRSSVIVTHLAEVVRRHADELLTRQQVKEMLDALRQAAPVVVDELVSSQLPLGELQRVLRDLLAERVPVRNLAAIVEAVVDRARQTHEPDALLEAAREALGGAIGTRFATGGKLPVAYLVPELELRLVESLVSVDGRRSLGIAHEELRALRAEVAEAKQRAEAQGLDLVLVTMGAIRRPLWAVLARTPAELPVLALGEIGSSVDVVQMGVIGGVQQPAAL